MKTPNILICALLLFVVCTSLDASPVINDHFLRGTLHRALIEVAERDVHVTGRDLANQLEAAQGAELHVEPHRADSGGKMDYDTQVQGVVLVGAVFKCGNCDQWHLSRVATGWVLSEDFRPC